MVLIIIINKCKVILVSGFIYFYLVNLIDDNIYVYFLLKNLFLTENLHIFG